MDCKIDRLDVSSGKGISLIANSNPNAMCDSAIGITGINGSAIATISVNAKEKIYMHGEEKSRAVIANHIGNPLDSGIIDITANDFILDGKGENAYVQGQGPLSITTNKTFFLKNKAWIENKGGPLVVTTLGDAYISPQSSIANLSGDPLSLSVSYQETQTVGKLTMEKGATLEGSNVTLYLTSKANHELNGFSLCNLVTDEEIKIILPPAAPEVPQTLFYKDNEFIYHNIQRSQLLVSRMLTDFHPMNEYLGWFERFQVADKENDLLYFLRMRNVSFNSPKNETIITFPKML